MRVLVRGPRALEMVVTATSVVREARGDRSDAAPLVFAAAPPDATEGPKDPRAGVPFPEGGVVLDADESRVVLRERLGEAEASDEGVVPPSALVADVLRGVPLATPPAGVPRLLAGLALLVRGDAKAARDAIGAEASGVGARVVLAYADVVVRDRDPAARLTGLEADPDVGPVARFLVGAALLAAGSPKEARNDLDAARRARPALWPAALLSGVASETLDLRDDAAAAYADVLVAVPGHALARVLLAAARVHADPDASLRELEAVVAERKRFVAAWRELGEVRSRPGPLADADAAAKAFAQWASLRPKEVEAWNALANAHVKRAEGRRAPEALEAAAEAFARVAQLRPTDPMAWFNRGAALQHAAHVRGATAGVAAFRSRLLESRACYAKALARGLPREQAARAYYNLGLLLDAIPAAAGEVPGDLPSTALAAFEAARAADPDFDEAPLAIVAARVALRDPASAARALGDVPAAADPAARGTLEAAVRWLTASPTAPPPAAKRGEPDALASIARSLVSVGYGRAALALLDGEERSAERLAERVRAHAYLLEAPETAADLARVEALDPERAQHLRAHPAIAPLLAK